MECWQYHRFLPVLQIHLPVVVALLPVHSVSVAAQGREQLPLEYMAVDYSGMVVAAAQERQPDCFGSDTTAIGWPDMAVVGERQPDCADFDMVVVVELLDSSDTVHMTVVAVAGQRADLPDMVVSFAALVAAERPVDCERMTVVERPVIHPGMIVAERPVN